jgi:hypothetical protein
MKSDKPIIADKELFRLWYEYYQLALESADPKIQKAVKESQQFYSDWNASEKLTFDTWWKSHRKLFHDDNVVRLASPFEMHTEDNLYVIIPKTKSQNDIIEEFKALVTREFGSASKRRKLSPVHRYAPTEIQGVKRDSLRMMLDLQKHIFSKQILKGVVLRERVIKFFGSERYKRRRNYIPMAFNVDNSNRLNDHAAEADRNIRRYRQKANALLLNVASGKFPGKY